MKNHIENIKALIGEHRRENGPGSKFTKDVFDYILDELAEIEKLNKQCEDDRQVVEQIRAALERASFQLSKIYPPIIP